MDTCRHYTVHFKYTCQVFEELRFLIGFFWGGITEKIDLTKGKAREKK